MNTLLKLWVLAIVFVLGLHQGSGQYSWTKDAHNPVLVGGGVGGWNKYVGSPCVLFNADSARYEMWFTGYTGNLSQYNDYRPYSIGRAVSTDGISWTMDASPVLTPGAGTWDAHTIECPMVIRDSGQYKMWYESWLTPSSQGYMGYATSPDGKHWTKYSGNPVMGPGKAAWEAGGLWSCFVLPVRPSGGYRAWYSAVDAGLIKGGIGYATSADGIVWVKDTVNNPVLSEAPGKWDDTEVGAAQILHIADSMYIWYAAFSSGLISRDIGLATSKDGGPPWNKVSLIPVLKHSPGEWDGSFIACGSVLLLPGADSVVMWYEGLPFQGPTSSIGRAVSPMPYTGILGSVRNISADFKLVQNYPNPFNPSTTICYSLPHRSEISLTVHNTLGQLVSTLVQGQQEAGSYGVKFDGSACASGVYFYRIQGGDFVATKRMLLMR